MREWRLAGPMFSGTDKRAPRYSPLVFCAPGSTGEVSVDVEQHLGGAIDVNADRSRNTSGDDGGVSDYGTQIGVQRRDVRHRTAGWPRGQVPELRGGWDDSDVQRISRRVGRDAARTGGNRERAWDSGGHGWRAEGAGESGR